jgi:tetratricopeptide (TPR) repeat protein
MVRTIIIIFLVASSAAFSYFYSEEVYTFYVKTWYTFKGKPDKSKHLQELMTLQKRGEWSNLSQETRIHTILYPDDAACHIVVARAYNVRKNPAGAALSYRRALKGKNLSRDLEYEALHYLYQERYFGDLVFYLQPRESQLSGRYLTILGASYYETGKYYKALKALYRAGRGGASYDHSLYYGLSYLKLKEYPKASHWLKKAFSLNPGDDRVVRNLIAAYRGAGEYSKADKVIQRKMR